MKRKLLISLLALLAVVGAGLTARAAFARTPAASQPQPSVLHPVFDLLDAGGANVLDSGQPVSTMNTCGQCHDTAFIASHSMHVDLGQTGVDAPGEWNPLTYRYAQPDEAVSAGMSSEAWIQANAARLVGGGLAESSGVEMNCFLCHFADPNLDARTQAIEAGDFAWANTASLVGTGLVEQNGGVYTWNKTAFAEDGKLLPETMAIQDPTNENCAQCHGAVQTSKDPLVISDCTLDQWQTATTGQVISPDKISNSGMNLADKDSLTRPFDVHAERGLKCTDCHYSLNNPAFYQAGSSPTYLTFDPRHLDIGDYLQRPDHDFARSQSAQATTDLVSAAQNCESCHDAKATHSWLPYLDQHLDKLACESCHVPQLYAPAVQSQDWTVLSASAASATTASSAVAANSACRGVEGSSASLNNLLHGFTPVLLPRQNADGSTSLAPYNLVTSWYWVAGAPPAPVSLDDLQSAWYENTQVAPEIVSALDANNDGVLDETELVLDTPAKQSVVAGRLSALGLADPHIVGEIQPYSINHNVTGNEWAMQDCKTCHSDQSRITQPMLLAASVPGGVMPQFSEANSTLAGGSIYTEDGALYYRAATADESLYVFGHDRVAWVDGFGALFFVGVLLGVAVHGGLRFYAALKMPHPQPAFKKVYMYSVYERFWHWLQTFAIVLLLFTGLIIHRPDLFGLFSFPYVVAVHNVLAALLVINATLSLFYHLVSGNIRQFLPHPYGFFDEAILQAKFYLQGIFKGAKHPFEKAPEKKLNPLQQATYFGILNVLLPLQIITGALMWGVQQWPQIANSLGGLPFLAPFHSLIAWVFGGFIVGHVYLTTTGPQPLTSIKAMVMGWEDVEEHTPYHHAEADAGETAQAEPNTSDLEAGTQAG